MMRTRDKGYPVGRGALLIINQGTFTSPDLTCREPGTNVDRDNLELVFRSLGYGVHIANNCNGDAFEEHLENAVDLIGDGVGPFVLAFLSHGGSGDCLYFADGTHMSMSAIRRALQGHRTLDGRPKIIIVQACRGPEHLVVLKDGSTEIRIEGEDFSPDSVIADPMADTIIMWSCMEERVAYRHPDIGSMFITLTCDEILKNMSLAKRTPPSGEKHIPDLSMSVHKNMERYGTKCHGFRMLTSPENISSLKKPLFLGPPVDEDKFRRAVGRISQLRLKLSRATGQVVSNLQADDAQKGPGCHCVDDCAPSGTCRCRQAGAPCGPECRHDGGPRNKSDECANAPRVCQCKGGCGSGRCGCRKYSVPCGEQCHPGAPCGNRQAPREFSSSGRPGPGPSRPSAAAAAAPPKRACSCRKGCGTYRCGCRGTGLACSPACHGGATCHNDDSFLKQRVDTDDEDDENDDDENDDDENDDDEDRLALATGGASAGAAGQSASSGQRGCGCKPTGCGKSCGCVKKGVLCVANCHRGLGGNLCKNNRTPSPIRPSPAANVKVKFERAQSSKGSKEKSAATNPDQVERGSSDEETDDEESVVCGCKSGCGTKRCSCQKADLDCGPRCHGGSPCQNYSKSSGKHGKEKLPPPASGDSGTSDEETDDEDNIVCGCKTGCGTTRCGCQKADLDCSPRCHGGSPCQNYSKSGEETDDEDSVVCGCKTGCGTKRCGCQKVDFDCGPRCHGGTPCENLPKKGIPAAKGPKQKSKPAIRGNVNFAQTACQCQTGCENSRCGCRKAGSLCGPQCHRGVGPNCANRFKPSGADKKVKCSCKTGCLAARCSCRKADVLCGPSCHPGEQCKN